MNNFHDCRYFCKIVKYSFQVLSFQAIKTFLYYSSVLNYVSIPRFRRKYTVYVCTCAWFKFCKPARQVGNIRLNSLTVPFVSSSHSFLTLKALWTAIFCMFISCAYIGSSVLFGAYNVFLTWKKNYKSYSYKYILISFEIILYKQSKLFSEGKFSGSLCAAALHQPRGIFVAKWYNIQIKVSRDM